MVANEYTHIEAQYFPCDFSVSNYIYFQKSNAAVHAAGKKDFGSLIPFSRLRQEESKRVRVEIVKLKTL